MLRVPHYSTFPVSLFLFQARRFWFFWNAVGPVDPVAARIADELSFGKDNTITPAQVMLKVSFMSEELPREC